MFCLSASLSAASLCYGAALPWQTGQNANAAPPAANPSNQTAPAQPKPAANADANPFPMEQSQAAARSGTQNQTAPPPADNSQGNPAAGSAGAAGKSSNASSSRKSSAATDNPFPEEQSKAAAAKPDPASAAPEKSAGANAGSTAPGSYSSSDAHLPPPDLGEGETSRHQKLDSFTRDQSQDGRIEDDLNVADLYMKNGNYRGAFLRYQDAIKFDPQNDTALYGAAVAMCRQNMTSEAMARFKSYTKSNPQGKYALKAEKMLAHPSKCRNNW